MIIHRPERFDPKNGTELRKAIKETFVGEEDLVLCDVVYERAPSAPEGEVGLIAQTRSGASLFHDYSPLPPMQSAFKRGGLAESVQKAKNRILDQVAVAHEGRSYESDEDWARAYLKSFDEKDGRTCTGSLLVRDPEAHRKRFDQFDKIDKPLRGEGYLRLRGWIRLYELEIYEEARRKVHEEGKHAFEVTDNGIRYTKGNSGVAVTLYDALGSQMHMDALNVGGFEAYMELIDGHRIDQ